MVSLYVRTEKTASGATSVQIVHSSRRGLRDVEHIRSAHDEAEVKPGRHPCPQPGRPATRSSPRGSRRALPGNGTRTRSALGIEPF